MSISAFASSSLFFAVALVAQTPTVTGTITQALTVSATGSPTQQQTVPIGLLPTGGANLSASALPLSTASMQWAPTGGHPAGVAGFRVQSQGSGYLNFSLGAGSFTTSGEVVLQLTMPTPTPVLVVVSGTAQAFGGSTLTQVDLDNDGSVDVSLASSTFSPNSQVEAEFGLLVGPAGRTIRIQQSNSGSAMFSSALASSDLEIKVHAGAYPISAYGPGCLSQTYSRSPTGAPTLHCPAGNGSLAFFVVGLNAMQVPLALAPGCYQLTDVVFAVLALPTNGQASYALLLPTVPPGFEVRTQVAVINSLGTIQTSNGLLVVGPD